MERIQFLKHLIEAIEDDLRQIKIELDDLQAEEVHRQNRGNPEQRGRQRGQQRGQQRGNAQRGQQRGNQRVPPQIPQRGQQRAPEQQQHRQQTNRRQQAYRIRNQVAYWRAREDYENNGRC